MRNFIGYSVIAAGAGLALTMVSAGIAEAHKADAAERAELAQLSPDLRNQIEARMTGDQHVRAIEKTILLNNVSLQYGASRVVSVDFDKGVVVVEAKGGEAMSHPFDVTTLALTN